MQPFLEDLTVLDLTGLLPGQMATMLLADLGADVVKIERPGTGDPTRNREPMVGDRSYAFMMRNHSKDSVALNLKHEAGREAFLDLAEAADVVVEAFRPGVVDRLGVGYDDIQGVNEDIIYCSITGYGQDGPYAQRPGHDMNYIGVGGLLALTGDPDGDPVFPGYAVADCASAIYAAFAISAAAAGVANGTGGEYIDVSMTDAVASFGIILAPMYFGDDIEPRRGNTFLTGAHPGCAAYETADGEYLSFGALEHRFWAALCEAVGLADLGEIRFWEEDISKETRHRVEEQLAERLVSRPADEWIEIFDEHDVPVAPVNGYSEMFDDPQLKQREVFDRQSLPYTDEEITYFDTPLCFDGDRKVEKTPAPELGADTAKRLEAVGYDAETLVALENDDALSLG
ncbi:MAG: CaiB/BaiF CoA transferase family protein [Salinirussus sp.]